MFSNVHAKSYTRSYAECLLTDYFSHGGQINHVPAGVSGLPDDENGWLDYDAATELDVAEFAARNGLASLS